MTCKGLHCAAKKGPILLIANTAPGNLWHNLGVVIALTTAHRPPQFFGDSSQGRQMGDHVQQQAWRD
jgi:hypothetical protein